MYNILGELKNKDDLVFILDEEKRKQTRVERPLKDGSKLPTGTNIYIEIPGAFNLEFYFIPRFLLMLGKTLCMPHFAIWDKNIESNIERSRFSIPRTAEAKYFNHVNPSTLLDTLMIRLYTCGITIGPNCQTAMEHIFLYKFMPLSESQFQAKYHKKKCHFITSQTKITP